MCFVRGLYFEVIANSLAPSFYSNRLHLDVMAVVGGLRTVESSTSKSRNGRSSRIYFDGDMYSASVVPREITI